MFGFAARASSRAHRRFEDPARGNAKTFYEIVKPQLGRWDELAARGSILVPIMVYGAVDGTPFERRRKKYDMSIAQRLDAGDASAR